ncbi:hypothetical protein KR009_000620 [Drosophila setifemur]|nr:hypothetical protein KR009_000620 [Drosophila setifemur]
MKDSIGQKTKQKNPNKPINVSGTNAQVEARQKETIELMHEYNDLKDAAQIVLGALATMRNVPVRTVYPKYNLPIEE